MHVASATVAVEAAEAAATAVVADDEGEEGTDEDDGTIGQNVLEDARQPCNEPIRRDPLADSAIFGCSKKNASGGMNHAGGKRPWRTSRTKLSCRFRPR